MALESEQYPTQIPWWKIPNPISNLSPLNSLGFHGEVWSRRSNGTLTAAWWFFRLHCNGIASAWVYTNNAGIAKIPLRHNVYQRLYCIDLYIYIYYIYTTIQDESKIVRDKLTAMDNDPCINTTIVILVRLRSYVSLLEGIQYTCCISFGWWFGTCFIFSIYGE